MTSLIFGSQLIACEVNIIRLSNATPLTLQEAGWLYYAYISSLAV